MIFSHGDYYFSRNTRNARNFIYLPQITQITRIHFSFFRCALWLRQMRSTDLHRFLPCGISFFRHEDMRTWSFFTEIILLHKFHSLFSLKRLFLPQIVALRHLFFLDMKTWEYDFLSRNSRFIVGMGIGRCDYAGCFIVYLSYIYSIFMVYL